MQDLLAMIVLLLFVLVLQNDDLGIFDFLWGIILWLMGAVFLCWALFMCWVFWGPWTTLFWASQCAIVGVIVWSARSAKKARGNNVKR